MGAQGFLHHVEIRHDLIVRCAPSQAGATMTPAAPMSHDSFGQLTQSARSLQPRPPTTTGDAAIDHA